MRPRRAWVIGVAAAFLLAGAAACGSGGANPSPRPTVRYDLSTGLPSPLATDSLAGDRTGLRVVSVIPPAYARGPWSGDQVIVAYLPAAAPVVASRCRLYVDGRRQAASVRWNAISPGQPVILFSWDAAYSPGTYRLRAVLVTANGATAEYDWPYTYR
jgi:hypothetical protein